ncbi:MAG: hypothetical protein GTN73_11185 [Candidatus Aminicenantes bacterium]|nr:hypothetical protein [Candidatus Aminicenantes bacterium]
MKRTFSLLIVSLFLSATYSSDDIAIKGGTIIDVADWGKSANDIKNAIVLIKRGRIAEVGETDAITIAKGKKIIDASGKFIVPGLFDGFAAATTGFADTFGWNELGEVKPGRKADILVLNKNPLENIENLKDISLLILNGDTIDREALLKK